MSTWLTRCLDVQIHGRLEDPGRRSCERRWRWCCGWREGKMQTEVRLEAYKPRATERIQSNVESEASYNVFGVYMSAPAGCCISIGCFARGI